MTILADGAQEQDDGHRERHLAEDVAQSAFCRHRRMSPRLFYLFFLPFAFSSGYLELRLKAAFPLNVTVEMVDGVYYPTNKRVFHMPLPSDEVRILTGLSVKFGEPGVLLINSGPVKKFGLAYETVRSERWNTEQMTITADQVHLPFTGIVIDIKCDRNWFGTECDIFCDVEKARIEGKRCTSIGEHGCPEGLRGWSCDRFVSNDARDCGCLNGGVCSQLYRSSMICECPIDHEGPKCEKKKYDYSDPLEVRMFYEKDQDEALINEFQERSLVDNELASKSV